MPKRINHNNALEYDDALVNAGLFFGSAPFISVPGGGFAYALLTTAPTREVHGQLSVTATDRIDMTISHAPTVSDNGTPALINNFKTFSTNIPDTNIYTTPTVSDEGTIVTKLLIPGGGGQAGIGVSASAAQKFILPPNQIFLIKFTDETAGGQPSTAVFQFNFFEKLFPTPDIKVEDFY